MTKKNIILALAALIFLVLAYFVGRSDLVDQGFKDISRGMSKSEVVGLLGEPNVKRNECRDPPTWDGEDVLENKCTEEWQYDGLFLPKFLVVGFGKNDRVISKYGYVSP